MTFDFAVATGSGWGEAPSGTAVFNWHRDAQGDYAPACRRYNGGRCRFDSDSCRNVHACLRCGASGPDAHPARVCPVPLAELRVPESWERAPPNRPPGRLSHRWEA